MKAKEAVILVKLDDDKVYQVDVSSTDVLLFVQQLSYRTNGTINVLDKPIEGMVFEKVLECKE